MHSTSVRFNVLVTTSLTYLIVLHAFCILYSWLKRLEANPQATVSFGSLVSLKKLPNQLGESAVVTFQLDADLQSMWNLNVKYIYLYLVAEYSSPRFRRNQATVWDRYVERGSSSFSAFPFYNSLGLHNFVDTLRNASMIFRLEADIIPFVGFVFHTTLAETMEIQFPLEYTL
ncbi:hypothetical protein Gasu2_49510 [Galdieria sulphuraria]|uniref:Signal peptidase complex subunit 3 n=1 Tax=Galdieria sulphuraria TaxID=130081 RepID=M2W4N4_GALSU|nr:signal peptidase subunit family protein [Galdieria sulphuraria]EME30706.1 signal peptidase subunit family protein [Galdieria sulphuraria]GJD10781.1 hypothetical protein Gasu2_49510 [Galdieria sulphuraria]|eukprot:XP_005707226.1 signal peptidase subunit family protein [Galdieria sulphuraria]